MKAADMIESKGHQPYLEGSSFRFIAFNNEHHLASVPLHPLLPLFANSSGSIVNRKMAKARNGKGETV